MTDRELLEKLVISVDNINTRLDRIEADVSGLKNDVSGLKTDVSNLKTSVADLENAQARTTAVLEGTIDKCIQVLYECHTMNAERLDKFDTELIKRNSEIAVALAKAASDKVDHYIKQTA